MIAAPLLASEFPGEWVGLENHLNYIYRKQGSLETEEIYGLSALFNSALVDRYVRIANGNTQVNAAELRALPLPPLQGEGPFVQFPLLFDWAGFGQIGCAQ